MSLKRVRVMNIALNDLPEGKYRNLTKEETRKLYAMIKDSSNAPKIADIDIDYDNDVE